VVDEAKEKVSTLKSVRALIALVGLALVMVMVFVIPFGACAPCHGYGKQVEACESCKGTGSKKAFLSGKMESCSACSGKGKLVGSLPCRYCSGSGKSTLWNRCH
jgi:hypothetical protein